MTDKAIVIVKRLSNPKEMEAPEVRYHRFYAMDRTENPNVSPLTEITTETQFSSTVQQRCDVIAVLDAPFQVPLVVRNARAIDAGRRFDVYAWLSVKIDPSREFCSWVRGKLLKKGELTDIDIWEELYGPFGLGDFFKALFNEANVSLLEKHGKGAIDFSGMAQHLPSWLPWSKETILSCFPEPSSGTPSSELQRAIDAVGKIERIHIEEESKIGTKIKEGTDEVLRNWGTDLKEALKKHPFLVVFSVIAFFILFSIFKGCFTDWRTANDTKRIEKQIEDAARIEKKKKAKPTKGTLSVLVEKKGTDGARELLKRESEKFALQVVEEVSEKTKSWRNGEKITLPAQDWEKISTRVQAFAVNSDEEFSCTISGNDITLIAHPQAVRTVSLDISALRGDTGLIEAVQKAFNIRFGGNTVASGIPIRSRRLEEVRQEVSRQNILIQEFTKGTLAFSPDLGAIARTDPSVANLPAEELLRRADTFWRDVAPGKFVSIPQTAKELRQRFAPLDHPFTEGFDEAEKQLDILRRDIIQTTDDGIRFLAVCNVPWRQFSSEIPADKNAKLRDIQDAVKSLGELKAAVDTRYNRVAFDRDVAAFDAKKTEMLEWSRRMFACYQEQQDRIAQLRRIQQDILTAKETRDFSKIPEFEKRIDEAESRRAKKMKYETDVGMLIASYCQETQFHHLFGDQWTKAMITKYREKVAQAESRVRQRSAVFAEEVTRCFQTATLKKALSKGDELARALKENHRALSETEKKSVYLSEDPRETALLFGLRNGVQMLRRAQMRSSQQVR